jgi:hypothetical protein
LCHQVSFCSSACSTSPRGRLHAKECAVFHALVELEGPTGNLLPTLVVRTLLSKSLDEWRDFSQRVPGCTQGEADDFSDVDVKREYVHDDYDNVFRLVKKTRKREPLSLLSHAFHSVLVIKMLKATAWKGEKLSDDLVNFLGGVALRHFQNFELNIVETFDYVSGPPGVPHSNFLASGVAIHPTLSLFNFSCDANVIVTFYADVVVATVRRPVKAGDMLTMRVQRAQYQTAPKWQRQEFLKKEYFYVCGCKACQADWPTHRDLLDMSRQEEVIVR